jgi:hypothetical protein
MKFSVSVLALAAIASGPLVSNGALLFAWNEAGLDQMD